MKKAKLLIVVICIGMLAPSIHAQCYQRLRSEGLGLMQKKYYGEATNRFWAALITCADKPSNNDLSNLIQQCQNKWVKDLEQAVQKQKEAYQTAVVAQKEAESAKVSEENARKEAEANAKKALEQGIKAESLRLALISDMIREKGRKDDALLLAYLALQMAGPETSPFIMRAFGEAVSDSLGNVFFTSPGAAESLEALDGGQTMLLKTKDGAFYILQPGENNAAARFTQLDHGLTGIIPSPKENYFAGWSGNNAQLFDVNGDPVATFTGHTEVVRSAVCSPDGRTLGTCSNDNTARLWDRNGRLRAVCTGHTANVLSLDFAPDGSFLLTRSADGTARTWDTLGNPIGVFEADGKFLWRVFLSPAGDRIAGIFSDGSSALWTPDGKHSGAFETGNEKIQGDFIFIPNTLHCLARLDDQSVGIWSVADGRLLGTLHHPAHVTGLNISFDGTCILTWAKDRVVRLWSAGGVLQREFQGHYQGISGATLSSDNKFLLTTSRDGTVKMWDNAGNILTEWVSGAGIPAQFNRNGLGVILVLNDGRSLAYSPFPGNVYQSMDREKILSSAAMARLIGEFNVQFSEGIFQSK